MIKTSFIVESRGRHKIGVDNSLGGLVPFLQELGFTKAYEVDAHPALPAKPDRNRRNWERLIWKDKQINNDLNATKTRYFVTRNAQEFEHLAREYTMIAVNSDYELFKLANKISQLFIEHPHGMEIPGFIIYM